jgi:hypothetical protein
MTYRTGTIKRRTAAETAQLEEQILGVLLSTRQSVRHVFYRMTDPTLPVFVEKSNDGYRQVQHLCTKMRRDGRLPYGWLTDSSRRGYYTNTYRNAGEFLRRVKSLYRADLWQDAPYYCEVWVESRSVAGVVEDLCQELAVSLFPAGGFSSITFIYEAAVEINETVENPVEILYIGDYDPAGVLIDKSIERQFHEHLDSDIELHFNRVAITPEQIAELHLPTKPRKPSDPRSPEVGETVEAEAMPAETLLDRLRQEIEMLLPERALEVAKVAEESEKKYLDLLATMPRRKAKKR